MNYRVNFCWEDPKRTFHKHIVSVPWDTKAQLCFTDGEMKYINNSIGNGYTPGITISTKRAINRIMENLHKPLPPGADHEHTVFACWEHFHNGDTVIAWIEREDQTEVGHYGETENNL